MGRPPASMSLFMREDLKAEAPTGEEMAAAAAAGETRAPLEEEREGAPPLAPPLMA